MVKITYDLDNKEHNDILNDYYFFKYYIDIINNDILKNRYIKDIFKKYVLIQNISNEDKIIFNKIINDCLTQPEFIRFKELYYHNIYPSYKTKTIADSYDLYIITTLSILGVQFTKQIYRQTVINYFNNQNRLN